MVEMNAAQAQLREIVRDLEAIKYRMRGCMRACLSRPPRETRIRRWTPGPIRWPRFMAASSTS